mmetsp:Transcript_45118/g.144489  ORF Transcript_45118/g.144489 Transcript_45118/m.144489 type:complete len:212 (+) Transcript_45118:946-1581(+)
MCGGWGRQTRRGLLSIEDVVARHHVAQPCQAHHLLVKHVWVLPCVPPADGFQIPRRDLLAQSQGCEGGEHTSAVLRNGRGLDEKPVPDEVCLLPLRQAVKVLRVNMSCREELRHQVMVSQQGIDAVLHGLPTMVAHGEEVRVQIHSLGCVHFLAHGLLKLALLEMQRLLWLQRCQQLHGMLALEHPLQHDGDVGGKLLVLLDTAGLESLQT